MLIKLKFLLPIVIFFLLTHVAVLAQENAQPDGNVSSRELNNRTNHIEANSADEKNPVIDFEAKSPKFQSAQKEEIATPKKEESAKNEKKVAEEDPLSFNFLYLIIQKFKISDIVQEE